LSPNRDSCIEKHPSLIRCQSFFCPLHICNWRFCQLSFLSISFFFLKVQENSLCCEI
jgi:hypothetical protein